MAEADEVQAYYDQQRRNRRGDEIMKARQEGRAEILALVTQLAATIRDQAEKGAHTYASENADHYRGFDAGLTHAARQLDRLIKSAHPSETRQEET